MGNDVNGQVFRAEQLDRDALNNLLLLLFDEQDSAIVRRVEDAQFITFERDKAAAILDAWTDGQIFGADAELRWRRVADSYDVLLLTERADYSLPADFRPLNASPFKVVAPSSRETHGLLLWGTTLTTEGYWLETRIPRQLHYPIKTKKSLRLSYLLYQEGAAVRWVRLRS